VIKQRQATSSKEEEKKSNHDPLTPSTALLLYSLLEEELNQISIRGIASCILWIQYVFHLGLAAPAVVFQKERKKAVFRPNLSEYDELALEHIDSKNTELPFLWIRISIVKSASLSFFLVPPPEYQIGWLVSWLVAAAFCNPRMRCPRRRSIQPRTLFPRLSILPSLLEDRSSRPICAACRSCRRLCRNLYRCPPHPQRR